MLLMISPAQKPATRMANFGSVLAWSLALASCRSRDLCAFQRSDICCCCGNCVLSPDKSPALLQVLEQQCAGIRKKGNLHTPGSQLG